MIVVFGGAFQGKRDYIIKNFDLKDSDIYEINEAAELDFSYKAFYGIEKFAKNCINNGINPIDYFMAHKDKFKDKILVCEDICCGIVPLEPADRLLRDNVGKILQLLCRNADEVYRIYCGIGERIK